MARTENKEAASPTVRLVADVARMMRMEKNLSQEELGNLLGYTGSAVSAMETCAQPASDQMLEALDKVFGNGFFTKAREYLRLDAYPQQFKDFFVLEQSVTSMAMYEPMVISGLFQTEGYARALIGGVFPLLTDARVDELVGARMARKALFDRDPPPMIEVVQDESALRRDIGSRKVMREQLGLLAELARRRNVTLQVMPLDRGLRGEHSGTNSSFFVLETAKHDHLVYLEAQDESIMVSDRAKVSTYALRYARIRAQALSPDESLGLIEQLAGEE